MKERIVIATIKSWNIENALKFKRRCRGLYDVTVIDAKDGLTPRRIRSLQPRYIFFPHWSWMIPASIYEEFECVIFHMTDLPYGRGGTPLQNLIVRGRCRTKISAIRATGALDAGPVYMKKGLVLNGKASDVYRRASDIVFGSMIPFILAKRPAPVSQKGKAVYFARLGPAAGDLSRLSSRKAVYDRIRMLDAEGYPPAYIETNGLRIEFTNASVRGRYITANANIEVKK